MTTDILNYWPSDYEPRQGQIDVLTWLEKQTAKYLIVQAPVGSGKSLIGMTFSRYVSGDIGHSYILTPQKILQAQYENSFRNHNVVSLYGKANYTCKSHGTSCDVGATLSRGACHKCPWKEKREEAKKAANVVFNYKLALTYFGYEKETFHKRALVVADEAHQLEQQLIDFDTVKVERATARGFSVDWPDIRSFNMEKAVEWLTNEFMPRLQQRVMDLEEQIEAIEGTPSRREAKMIKEHEEHKASLDQLTQICYTPLDQLNETHVCVYNMTEIQIKCLTAESAFEHVLKPYGNRFLFMSSTIIDPKQFCKDLGIDPDEAAFYDLDSEFPAENRPVAYLPQMKMNASWNKPERRDELKRMGSTITGLIAMHTNESGIIHTGNYKIAEWLVTVLAKQSTHRVIHHNPNDHVTRDEAINDYLESASDEPCVLISPSITEGLDLIGDLGRFAIVAKIPYGFLGDQWIKKRMDMSNEWYRRRAIIDIIQGGGRVVRSKEDTGTMYIVDESWGYLFSQTSNSIPQWWKDAYTIV
jgi:Rad3-related DNA helicase